MSHSPTTQPTTERSATIREVVRTNDSEFLDRIAHYGLLARVAIQFHVATGNPAELDAAFVYARTAASYALEDPADVAHLCPCGCGSAQDHQEY